MVIGRQYLEITKTAAFRNKEEGEVGRIDRGLQLAVVVVSSAMVWSSAAAWSEVGGFGAPAFPLQIDIKPGSPANRVNPTASGRLPVAVLNDPRNPQLDQINVASLRFGPGQARVLHASFEDVDADGDPDLLMHFRTTEALLVCSEGQPSLRGETFSGMPLEGIDGISFVAAGTPGGGDPIILTNGHDDFTGTNQDETIYGEGGHDFIASQGGDDYVEGGDGRDVILTGRGNDMVVGGADADTILTGPGEDVIIIRAGDVPAGGTENIFGGADRDTVVVDFDYTIVGSGPNLVIIEDPLTGGLYVIQDVERIIIGPCGGPPIL